MGSQRLFIGTPIPAETAQKIRDLSNIDASDLTPGGAVYRILYSR